jgi:hypothetical protein
VYPNSHVMTKKQCYTTNKSTDLKMVCTGVTYPSTRMQSKGWVKVTNLKFVIFQKTPGTAVSASKVFVLVSEPWCTGCSRASGTQRLRESGNPGIDFRSQFANKNNESHATKKADKNYESHTHKPTCARSTPSTATTPSVNTRQKCDA